MYFNNTNQYNYCQNNNCQYNSISNNNLVYIHVPNHTNNIYKNNIHIQHNRNNCQGYTGYSDQQYIHNTPHSNNNVNKYIYAGRYANVDFSSYTNNLDIKINMIGNILANQLYHLKR